jgi:predicted alpha/beta superfamily hydrolase
MLQTHELADRRKVTVYLPPKYDSEIDRRHPVLYLHDGQNLFEAARAFGGQHWRVAETADQLIHANRTASLIIVGIDHTEQNRINEFTHTHDRRRGGGEAEAYARLLIDTVKPLIDSTYRTERDASHTAVGGSSLGGLVSLYLALNYAVVFSRAAVMSPSVWWDRRAILRDVRRAGQAFSAGAALQRPRIWVDMGTRESRGEGSARRVLEDARLLRAGLLKAGWSDDTLHYEELDGGTHSEKAWGDRFGRILEWLFPPKLKN